MVEDAIKLCFFVRPEIFQGDFLCPKGDMDFMSKNVSWMVKVAMLGALATVLMLFEFPLPFIAPPFYEMDLSEVPVLIGAFALGPLAGVIIELLKILLNLVINGTDTYFVGEIANFAMGLVFVLPASLIYKRTKTKKTAIVGLAVGSFSMVVLGCFINAYVMIPTYSVLYGMPLDAIVGMAAKIHSFIDTLFEFVLVCVAPFNLLKGIIVSIVTILVYKPLRRLIEKIEK